MLNREQDHFLQLLLCLFKSSDILPLDIGNLDVSFSKRSGVNCSHSEFEMLLIHSHSLQDLGIDFLSFDVDYVHLFTDTLESGFCA